MLGGELEPTLSGIGQFEDVSFAGWVDAEKVLVVVAYEGAHGGQVETKVPAGECTHVVTGEAGWNLGSQHVPHSMTVSGKYDDSSGSVCEKREDGERS